MALRIPTVLEAILEATAIETAAKARITGLRAVLETEARRRLAEEGAAPTWKARNAGSVRFDAPGDWSATVADADKFGSYVAERHPEEATAVLRLKVTDLADALTALGFVGIEHDGARVEVRPGFSAKYLADLVVDVEEQRGEDGSVDRTIRVIDPATGELVDGVSAQQANPTGKLVVTLDRDRRREVLEAAKVEAEALVAEATGQPAPAPVEPGRTVTLEELTTAGVVRPASELVPADEDRVALDHQAPGGHRRPYVGEGADGARRSAEIDRNEADTYDRDDARRDAALASAERWEAQAAELEAAATEPEEPARIPVDDRDHFTGREPYAVLDDPASTATPTEDDVTAAVAGIDAVEAMDSREALRRLARAKGINPGGTKRELAERLYAAGVRA